VTTARTPWREYLLGQLGEEEQDQLERMLLEGPQAAEALADAQDELIEDYLNAALPAELRAPFESHFVSAPEHRQAVEEARLLRDAMRERARPAARAAARVRPQPRIVAWAGLIAAVVAFVVFNLYRSAHAPTIPMHEASARTTPATAPSVAPLRIAMLSLAPGRVMARSADARVAVAASTDLLRLELLVEDSRLARYQVRLTARGQEIWTSNPVAAVPLDGGATVTVDVPAAKLGDAGGYEARLLQQPGGAVAGTYFFTVSRP
jgi:hypothetical protein